MTTAASGQQLRAGQQAVAPAAPPGLDAIRPATLRHQVESALREAIISGHLAPGARLIERQLCETLGVSRTSVREALRKLEAEKLVRNIPHKGPVVAVMSVQEATELYALRGLLEGFAAHEFARLASDAALARAGDAVRQLRAMGRARDPAGVLKAKAALYEVLLDNCGNTLVKEVLNSLYSRVNLLRATSLAQPERLPSSLAEIDALYGALKARDAAAAQQLAQSHVANAQQVAMRVLEQSGRRRRREEA
ncbi:MAG TPA: GntR family transcriptional regulator [Steroidobacteraceae bacterium]|jgi:DNA-binding GntR family transcriptional regulator|nr:GntR family transcriptional regulator [Steroidobacteraceae bacterium]